MFLPFCQDPTQCRAADGFFGPCSDPPAEGQGTRLVVAVDELDEATFAPAETFPCGAGVGFNLGLLNLPRVVHSDGIGATFKLLPVQPHLSRIVERPLTEAMDSSCE